MFYSPMIIPESLKAKYIGPQFIKELELTLGRVLTDYERSIGHFGLIRLYVPAYAQKQWGLDKYSRNN